MYETYCPIRASRKPAGAHGDGCGGWRFQRRVESEYGPTRHVEDHGDPGATDRKSIDVIDDDEIHWGVVGLRNSERPPRPWNFAGYALLRCPFPS